MFSVNPSDITFTNPIIIKFFNTYKNHPTLLTNLHITISASSKDTNTSYILPIRHFRIYRLPYLLPLKTLIHLIFYLLDPLEYPQ